MPDDVGLTHLALASTNLDASCAFYAEFAGMERVHSRGQPGHRVAWLSDKTRPFVLVLIEAINASPVLVPLAHLGVGCESRREVDRLCDQARAQGILIREPSESGPPSGYWAFLRDPDGHTLELSYGQQVGRTVEGRRTVRGAAATDELGDPLPARTEADRGASEDRGDSRIKLCPTTEDYLPFVLDLEAAPENAQYVLAWTRQEHVEVIRDAAAAHLTLIDSLGDPVGYVILTGLDDQHRGIEFKRIVVAAKGIGIGGAAVSLVKEFAFEGEGTHRLWLDVVRHNHRAQHVYRKAGFVEEGILRDSAKIDGHHVALVVMSLLRSEHDAESTAVALSGPSP